MHYFVHEHPLIGYAYIGGGPSAVDLVRIGDKLISRRKIRRAVDRVLERRAAGLSQQDVAAELGIDRAVISRLESLGEVRKGRQLAVVGFPIGNKDELEHICRAEGVDFVLLLNNVERWNFIQDASGAELFNNVLGIVARLKECDTVIFLGSDMRIDWVEAVLGSERVVSIDLGPSPLTDDCHVAPERLRNILAACRA